MKKRIIALFCILATLLPFSAVANAKSFSDVNEGDWYYNQIMVMTEKGLFEGKGNNLFCPDDTMTEAEFLTVLVRALYPEEDITPAPGEEWWQGVFDAAVKKGFIDKNDYEGTLSVGDFVGSYHSAVSPWSKISLYLRKRLLLIFLASR